MPLSKKRFYLKSQEYSTGVGVSSFSSVLRFEAPVNTSFRGELHIVSVVYSPDARLNKELRELVEQRYYSQDDRTAFEALTSTLGEALHLFGQRQISLEMGAVAVVDNVAYLVATNGAQIVLIRDGAPTTLLSSDESEVRSASGYIQDSDILMVVTHGFAEVVTSTRMQFLLDEVNDIQELRDSLVDEMAGFKRQISFSLIQLCEEVAEDNQEETAVYSPSPTSPGRLRKGVTAFLDRLIKLVPDRQMVIQPDSPDGIKTSRSRIPVVVGICLLLALLGSIWFGVRARNSQQKRAEYEDELLTAQHQFEEARSLTGINAGRAKELILSAQQTVNNLEQQGIEDPDLQVLGVSIEQNLGGIAGIYNQQPETFLDLSLIRADFQASDLAFSEGVVRVLDASNKRMTLINTDTKKTENIGELDILPNALQTTAYADETYILSNDGIREVQSEIELVVKDDDWNSENALIGAFGGNLYVLDKANNTIWRYPGGINSFGEGQQWFAPGINVDVTSAQSLAIDGKVWILSSGGKIAVYERGLPYRFVPEGISVVDGFRQIFTDETVERVYILDTVKSRIVVLEKTGAYIGEYQTPELSKAVDFVVSEADRKIIFLAENKLWELTLQ